LLSWQAVGKARTPRRTRTIDVDKEVLPLHNPFTITSPGTSLPGGGATNILRERSEEDQHIQQSLEQVHHASKVMNEWVFEENGVRIRCDWYVVTVSAVSAVLVLDGIAGGVGVGIDRPIGIRTILLSGLIMLQVQAPYHGKYLVYMDL
jgi:hypothetical protein